MTPSERITMWLSRRPLAEVNQRLWVAAILADGMRVAADVCDSTSDENGYTSATECLVRIRIKAEEMEKAQ